jgi:hypothetical protein
MVRVPEVDGVLDREGMRGLELLLLLSEATYGNPIFDGESLSSLELIDSMESSSMQNVNMLW